MTHTLTDYLVVYHASFGSLGLDRHLYADAQALRFPDGVSFSAAATDGAPTRVVFTLIRGRLSRNGPPTPLCPHLQTPISLWVLNLPGGNRMLGPDLASFRAALAAGGAENPSILDVEGALRRVDRGPAEAHRARVILPRALAHEYLSGRAPDPACAELDGWPSAEQIRALAVLLREDALHRAPRGAQVPPPEACRTPSPTPPPSVVFPPGAGLEPPPPPFPSPSKAPPRGEEKWEEKREEKWDLRAYAKVTPFRPPLFSWGHVMCIAPDVPPKQPLQVKPATVADYYTIVRAHNPELLGIAGDIVLEILPGTPAGPPSTHNIRIGTKAPAFAAGGGRVAAWRLRTIDSARHTGFGDEIGAFWRVLTAAAKLPKLAPPPPLTVADVRAVWNEFPLLRGLTIVGLMHSPSRPLREWRTLAGFEWIGDTAANVVCWGISDYPQPGFATPPRVCYDAGDASALNDFRRRLAALSDGLLAALRAGGS